MANEKDTVVGVFPDQAQAQRAVQALQSKGVTARIADKSAIQAFKATGLDNEVTSMYESRMAQGNSIVTADAGGQGDEVLGMMLDAGAEYVNLQSVSGTAGAATRPAASTQTTQTTQTTQRTQTSRPAHESQTTGQDKNADNMHVQLRDESLSAVKQNVQAGEVELHKVVHEKQEQVPVTLRHEEVYIERTPVDRPAGPNDVDMTDQVISVPVYEEQAELQKQARVREEVNISKRAQEEQQTLTGSTRHEDLEVTQSGQVEVVGEGGTAGDTTTTTTQQSNINQNKQGKRQ